MIRVLTLITVLFWIALFIFCGVAMAYGQSTGEPILAYVQESADRGADIYLFDLKSGFDLPLVDRPERDYFPTWSPDGNHLAFISDENGEGVLYVIGSDGSNMRALTSPDPSLVSEVYGVMEPGWTSSGDQLVLVQERPPSVGARRHLYFLIDPDTGETQQITDEDQAVQEYLAGFRLPNIPSPNGEYILRLATNHLASGLFILDSERQTSKLIHSLAPSDLYRSGSFSWSLDSQYVAFTVDQSASGGSRGVMFIVNVKTDKIRTVGSGLINHSPAWRP